jgi:hypothetical protein
MQDGCHYHGNATIEWLHCRGIALVTAAILESKIKAMAHWGLGLQDGCHGKSEQCNHY